RSLSRLQNLSRSEKWERIEKSSFEPVRHSILVAMLDVFEAVDHKQRQESLRGPREDMTVPLDFLKKDFGAEPRALSTKTAPSVTQFEPEKSKHRADIKRIWHADDQRASNLQDPVDFLHGLRSTFQMFEHFLQGHAVKMRISELQIIGAHLTETRG